MRDAVFAAAIDPYDPGQPVPSMADIASQAGVQKTTLYRRWGNAEALLHEAVTRQPREAIPVPDTGSLHDVLCERAMSGRFGRPVRVPLSNS